MKKVTCNLFRFNELSEEVRKNLIEENKFELAYDVMECFNSEYEATLKAFEKLFDCEVRKWQVDYCGSNYILSDFYPIGEYCNEISAKEIKGKYLLRVLNGIYDDIFPFKNFWGKFHYDENGKCTVKERRSKVLRNYDGCPLTGVCYDAAILEPIMNFLTKPDMNLSLYDLVDECVSNFFNVWQKEYDFWCENKENCLEEEYENRHEDDWYFSDGRIFDGIIETAA